MNKAVEQRPRLRFSTSWRLGSGFPLFLQGRRRFDERQLCERAPLRCSTINSLVQEVRQGLPRQMDLELQAQRAVARVRRLLRPPRPRRLPGGAVSSNVAQTREHLSCFIRTDTESSRKLADDQVDRGHAHIKLARSASQDKRTQPGELCQNRPFQFVCEPAWRTPRHNLMLCECGHCLCGGLARVGTA